jgi:hypothetical protein
MAATDSLKAMGKNGYDLSILRGRHYVKYGYVRAWNYVTYRLKAEEIPGMEVVSPYRLVGADKMDELNDVYNRNYSSYTGTCVRPTYRMLTTEDMQAYGWFDKTGRLKGYVRAVPTEDKKHLQCLEATGDPQQGLAVLSELFRQAEYESLTFFTIPHQHPILQTLRRGACLVETQYFHNTGWRVRILNLSSTLGKLRPLLNKRLLHSRYANWVGALRVDAGEQKATLQIEDGQVLFIDSARSEHNIRGGWQIARLLIGSDEPGEVIQQSGISCTGEADGLVEVLFPNLYPVMSHWDEY